MALYVNVSPGRTLGTTEKVTNAILNAGFTPTATLSGALDLSSQLSAGITLYGILAFGATSASTPVVAVPAVASKVFRVLGIKVFRVGPLSWNTATKVIIADTDSTQFAECSATNLDAASYELPIAQLAWSIGKGGAQSGTGCGIHIKTDAATTSGTVIVAVTGIYE